MSIRSWLSHPPIGVGLVVVLLLFVAGLLNDYRKPGGEQDPAAIENQQPQLSAQGCDADCKAERAEQRAADDLQAQKDMAKWAFYLLLVSGAGVLLLGATLYETRKAGQSAANILEATKRQVEWAEESVNVVRDHAQIELRPYIHVKGMQIRQGGRWSVEIDVANTGQTPPVFVRIGCTASMQLKDDAPPVVPIELKYSTWTIGANDTSSYGLVPSIDFESMIDDFKFGSRGRYVYVYGRLFYGDMFGETFESEFIYFSRGISQVPMKMARMATLVKSYAPTDRDPGYQESEREPG